MIKAVLFDVDGVLLDSFVANTKFFENLLESFGYRKPSREKASKAFFMTMLDAIRFLTSEPEKKVVEIWQRGHTFPYPAELLKVPKDGLGTVRKLRHRYSIGLVTSRIKVSMHRFFTATKMDGLFDVVVTFEDTKKHKPNPEPLLLAAKRLKVKPSEIVYIGDAPSDYKAAKTAGMKFIFYSKKPLKEADACVKTFAGIQDAVLKLEN